MKKLFPAFVLICVGLVVVGAMAARRDSSAAKSASNATTQAPIYAQAR